MHMHLVYIYIQYSCYRAEGEPGQKAREGSVNWYFRIVEGSYLSI